MKVKSLKLSESGYPDLLANIADPPKQFYWLGARIEDILDKPRVAVIGSRKATIYGRSVTHDITAKLAQRGVVIISGLAYGVDSYAHEAALKACGLTVSVLPSPLEKIYPAAHYQLAQQILKNGGALMSEYPAGTEVQDFNFIARNRLISALAEVLVIPEAAKNSGSLHTARFGLEQGKTVMAVPGNINSPMSEGCNNLIKSGAVPVTSVDDIFFALKISPQTKIVSTIRGTPEQVQIFELISDGVSAQEELAAASKLAVPVVSSTLTSLELQGYIRPVGGGVWTIA